MNTVPLPLSTVTLRASVAKEMENDVLRLQFLTQDTGSNPNDLQEVLRSQLADALAVIAPYKKPEEVETETGSFSVSPTYDKKQQITGYRGQVTLAVFGTDTATIASLASKVKTMVVYGTSNSLSRKKQRTVEKELVQEAIQAFKDKAAVVTKAFGNTNWTLGEIDVSASTEDRNRYTRGAVMASSAMSLEAVGGGTALEVESGKSTVSAMVSGQIVLDGAYGHQVRS